MIPAELKFAGRTNRGPRDGVLLFRHSRRSVFASMILVIFCLIAVSFAISWLVTRWMRRVCGPDRIRGSAGGRKIHANPKPLGGGVGIFWGLALPIICGLGYVTFAQPPGFLRSMSAGANRCVLVGARLQAPLAWEILAAGA